MKFDIGRAILYIFNDKKIFKKFLIFSIFILIYLIFGTFRSFFVSPHYFDDIANQISLALINFAPWSLFQFLGFPGTTPYLISFDIGQLAVGGLDICHLKAILMIFAATIPLSFIMGYFLCNATNQILDKQAGLPDLKCFLSGFKKGFTYIYGSIILTLPVLVLNLFAAKGVYMYYANLGGDDLGWLYAQIKPMVVWGITSLITFLVFLYSSIAVIPYLTNFHFKSIFKIKTVFKVIFGNFKVYLKYTGFILLFTALLGIIMAVAAFLHKILLEFKIFNFEPTQYIKSEDLNSFVLSAILILFVIPLVFWYFSIISNLQGQFIYYLVKKKKNKDFIFDTNKTSKKKKIIIFSVLFVYLTIFFVIFANHYKAYNTVNQYMNKLNFYGLAINTAYKDLGELDQWNIKNPNEFFNNIKDMLPIDIVCGENDYNGMCFEKDYPKLNGNGEVRITKKSFYKFKLKDGSTAAIYYNFPKCNINDSESGTGPFSAICGSIWFDINGKSGPNVYGRDLFQAVITKRGELLPRGMEDDKVYSIKNHCSNKKQSGDACGAWIMYHNNLDYLKN